MEHPSDTAGGAGPSPTVLQKLFRDWVSRQDAHQKRGYVKSWTGGSRTRPYAPHPPRFARHLPLKGKAFGRLIAVLSFRRGRTPAGPQMYAARPGGAPYGSAPAAACSANPGAAVGPHQQQFWNSQAPVGRIGPQKVTQILRAGNIAKPNKYASPVMGSGESGPMDLGRAKRSRSPSAASPAAKSPCAT